MKFLTMRIFIPSPLRSSIHRASFCNSAMHREGRVSMVQGASRGIGLEFVSKIFTHTFVKFYHVWVFCVPIHGFIWISWGLCDWSIVTLVLFFGLIFMVLWCCFLITIYGIQSWFSLLLWTFYLEFLMFVWTYKWENPVFIFYLWSWLHGLWFVFHDTQFSHFPELSFTCI